MALQDAPPAGVCKEDPEALGCDTCTEGPTCGQQLCGEPPHKSSDPDAAISRFLCTVLGHTSDPDRYAYLLRSGGYCSHAQHAGHYGSRRRFTLGSGFISPHISVVIIVPSKITSG